MSSSAPRDTASSRQSGARPEPRLDSQLEPDARLEALERWLTGLFGARDFAITVASADASFRRYFRVTRAGQSWIAMDAPPAKEDMKPYIRVASMLADVGVNAPRVLERNLEDGFLLNSDLGSRTYLMDFHAHVGATDAAKRADWLYGDAIEALVRIQAGAAKHAAQLPAYDDSLLRREMGLFPDWFCSRHLGLQLSVAEQAAMTALFDALSAEALKQPRVFVHRDYHSRNLMVCDTAVHGANPGILDFQDAVCGPITYDLVSLLRDCYVAWPRERVHGWMAQFRGSAARAGLNVGESEEAFRRWFDLMGVQRHLKAIGIFARLWHRDAKPGYLKDIPRTLGYVRDIASEYPQMRFLSSFIETRVLAALEAVATKPAAG